MREIREAEPGHRSPATRPLEVLAPAVTFGAEHCHERALSNQVSKDKSQGEAGERGG